MKMHPARRLSEAVGSWLHLEFCCYRAGLLSESALKAAVGQMMSTFPVASYGSRVYSDFPHDGLNPIAKRGKKRAVDFALVVSAPGVPKTNAEVLIEAKWAASSHCKPENIFSDFLRLASLKRFDPKSTCLFLLAGPAKLLSKRLDGMPFQSPDKINVGIGSSGSEKRLKLDSSNLSHRKVFRDAILELNDAKIIVPASFVVRANELHPIQSKLGTVEFQAMAWEIVSCDSKNLSIKPWL